MVKFRYWNTLKKLLSMNEGHMYPYELTPKYQIKVKKKTNCKRKYMIIHQKVEKSARQYVYGYINMLAKAYSYVWIDIHYIHDSGSYGEGERVRRGLGRVHKRT